MDKYEFKLKVDEMKALVNARNYKAAAEIAETINWRKIRNLNALVLAGEVFEQVERYEESKDILLMAYDKSPIGRNIIYRLAEIAIKTRNFEEAQEYYDEFVDIAPHDNLKFVLKYKMTAAQGFPYQEQIHILEELKEQEYSEEWAYELAYLYHRDGQPEKCVEACDELILWFGDGIYVEKALELKMHYQPLTKVQEEKYRLFRQKRTGVIEVKPEDFLESGEIVNEAVKIPSVVAGPERFNTTNLQNEIAKGMQQIINAKGTEAVSDAINNIKRATGEIPYLSLLGEAEAEEARQQAAEETAFEDEIDRQLDQSMNMILNDEQRVQGNAYGNQDEAQAEQEKPMSIEEILAEWEKTKLATQAVLRQADERKLESAKEKALQEAEKLLDRLMGIMPQLTAGVTPKELLEQEYLQGTGILEQQVQNPQVQEDLEEAGKIVAGMNKLLQEQIDTLTEGGQPPQSETAQPHKTASPTQELPDLTDETDPGQGVYAEEFLQGAPGEIVYIEQASADGMGAGQIPQDMAGESMYADRMPQSMAKESIYADQMPRGAAGENVYAGQMQQNVPKENMYIGQIPQGVVEEREYTGQVPQGTPEENMYMDQMPQGMPGENVYIGQKSQTLPKENMYMGQVPQGTPEENMYMGQVPQGTPEENMHTGQVPQGTVEENMYTGQVLQGIPEENMYTGQVSQDMPEEREYTGQVAQRTPEENMYMGQVPQGIPEENVYIGQKPQELSDGNAYINRVPQGIPEDGFDREISQDLSEKRGNMGKIPQEALEREAYTKQASQDIHGKKVYTEETVSGVREGDSFEAAVPKHEITIEMQQRQAAERIARKSLQTEEQMRNALNAGLAGRQSLHEKMQKRGVLDAGAEEKRDLQADAQTQEASFKENAEMQGLQSKLQNESQEEPGMQMMPTEVQAQNIPQEDAVKQKVQAQRQLQNAPQEDAVKQKVQMQNKLTTENLSEQEMQTIGKLSDNLEENIDKSRVQQRMKLQPEQTVKTNIMSEQEVQAIQADVSENRPADYVQQSPEQGYSQAARSPEQRYSQAARNLEQDEKDKKAQMTHLPLKEGPRFRTQAQLQKEARLGDTEEFTEEDMEAAAQAAGFSKEAPPKNALEKRLTPEQRQVFSYFIPILGMEAQIYDVLQGVSKHLRWDQDALTGNFVVEGIGGSGKTVLIMNIIKVLQKETQRPNNKIGKIDANALNQKDMEVLTNKVSGGCLIIESAGKISRETAVNLSECMEKDMAGTLYVLEDTKQGIQKALERDSFFASKFTEKISIPIFTNDDLVAFAKAYANDLGYDIDEMGILALYKRISSIQKLDHITTLAEVKEIVDEAVDRAERGALKKVLGIFKPGRYNNSNYIILREKDFEEP